MEPRTILDFMSVAERLKCNMRHSRTTSSRRESVAEHTYRLCVFAWLVKEEFPDCDMDKVMKMCLFHDLGEAVTGDIPAFVKTDDDRETEGDALTLLTAMLPEKERLELDELFGELERAETMEAKIVHALDKMETLIQHNEADIATWLPLEYDLQMTYGEKECMADPYLTKLREVIRQISEDKITTEGEDRESSYYIRKDIENMHLSEVTDLLRSTEWAEDRTEEMIRKSMENSCPYGLFLKAGTGEGRIKESSMAGKDRPDGVTTFYLMDLVIEETYRGQGFGAILMDQIMKENGHLYGMLHTQDAEAFYEKYGFYKEEQVSIVLEGADGAEKIKSMMTNMRNNLPEKIGKYKVIEFKDVELDEIKNLVTGEQRKTGLPKSNVLYYELENNAWCCVRPSGTEPKIKLYMGVKADSMESAEKDLEELKDAMVKLVK